MSGPRVWTCQRRVNGRRCGTRNLRIKARCTGCGGKRPAARVPSHRRVLIERAYELWVKQYGARCGICGKTQQRRLDRDHDHKTGRPRGLLCNRCNRALPSWVTAQWLRAAARYLDAAAADVGKSDIGNADVGKAEQETT